MTQLIVHVPDHNQAPTSETVFGGRPSAPNGSIEWPVCRLCEGNMQFLGQLRHGESGRLLLLFMCQNEPGLCDEWNSDGGGNKVLSVTSSSLQLVQPPTQGEVLRPTRYGAKVIEHPENDYDAARGTWAASNSASPREILGQLGGAPAWVQNEEVPICASCGESMQLVAQLEQGPDSETEMNFGGGGCAYVFSCSCNPENAKFLWQC
jgi:hypothetical protein